MTRFYVDGEDVTDAIDTTSIDFGGMEGSFELSVAGAPTMRMSVPARRGVIVGLRIVWQSLAAIVHRDPSVTFEVGPLA